MRSDRRSCWLFAVVAIAGLSLSPYSCIIGDVGRAHGEVSLSVEGLELVGGAST